MRIPARHHRPPALVVLLCCLAALGLAPPATAQPGGSASSAGSDVEGGSKALRDQLAAATTGYLDAKARLAASQRRQHELTVRRAGLAAEHATQARTVSRLAGAAYRTGRLGPVAALLRGGSPAGFLDRAASLTAVAAREDRQLRELLAIRTTVDAATAAINREVSEQRRQVAIMQVRRQQAEQALAVDAARQAARDRAAAADAAATGAGSTSGSGGTRSAAPAPRNADGSWPGESCSANDPTTSGCVTPRTLHALEQARAAGFTRFTSCYRDGGSGEHPRGRACDFAAQRDGFGGVATGGDRTYGTGLADYFVRNADRLGVLYVIWFRRIWLPSSGWKAYSGGNGDPSSDHTNHVHLSVY